MLLAIPSLLNSGVAPDAVIAVNAAMVILTRFECAAWADVIGIGSADALIELEALC